VCVAVTRAIAAPCARMLLASSIGACLLALTPIGSGSDLSELVRASDRIFVGTILETKCFEALDSSGKPVVRDFDRIRVERALFGDPAIREVIVDRPVGVWRDDDQPRTGTRAVFCTQLASSHWFQGPGASALLEWSGSVELDRLTLGWVGFFPVVESEGRPMIVIGAERNVINALQAKLREANRRPRLPTMQRALEGWTEELRGTILRETPNLSARFVTNGLPYSFTIESDRRVKGGGDIELRASVSRAELVRMLELLEGERFFELPLSIGRTLAPCAVSMEIRIQAAGRSRTVLIQEVPGESREEQDQHARGMRFWEAMKKLVQDR
jgi:hypothetical protein